jgi:hypothetical protein
MIRWIRLDKINVQTIYNLQFCDSWNITKQKKIEKIMQCPSKKSPHFLYGSEFLPKKRHYYAFIVQKWKNNIFWMKFHPKILNDLRFNSYINIIHLKKNSPKNSIHNLSFEIYMQFFKTLWQVLFCYKYTPYI